MPLDKLFYDASCCPYLIIKDDKPICGAPNPPEDCPDFYDDFDYEQFTMDWGRKL